MKELSIEEKAKRYDEALKWMENVYPTLSHEQQMEAEVFFPIFKESEDERIRKAIINEISLLEKESVVEQIKNVYQSWIAWLEKQGEQNTADKIEPKFHESDWVIDKQGIVHQIANVIKNVTYNTYGYDIVGGGYFNDNTEGVRLWTIQDAKSGNVLATKAGDIFIYKELLYDKPFAYCGIDKFGVFKDCNCGDGLDWTPYLSDVTPATKEQRDILEKTMADAGYTFDFEKKELKKEEVDNLHNYLYGEQKPAWSEEDKEMFEDTCRILSNSKECTTSNVRWLKSLRPQNKWKPSDKQIKAIKWVMDGDNPENWSVVLKNLYQDLKKLKK